MRRVPVSARLGAGALAAELLWGVQGRDRAGIGQCLEVRASRWRAAAAQAQARTC